MGLCNFTYWVVVVPCFPCMNLEIGCAYCHGGHTLKASCPVFMEEDRNVINIERKVSLSACTFVLLVYLTWLWHILEYYYPWFTILCCCCIMDVWFLRCDATDLTNVQSLHWYKTESRMLDMRKWQLCRRLLFQ